MSIKKYLALLPLSVALLPAPATLASRTYEEPRAFISQVFKKDPPAPQSLWLTGERKQMVAQIMGHELPQLRLRYWARDRRTAWILEEIGKTEPITTGIVINDGRIEQIKVLIYRESRGGEVRYPFFTQQFRQVELTDNFQLSRHIDGISGATLSVNALKHIAKLALYLHDQVVESSNAEQ